MEKKSYHKKPRWSRKITEVFNLKNATHFAGASILLDYINGTRLTEQYQNAVSIVKRSDSLYPMEDQLTALTIGRLLGVIRIHHFSVLERDPLLALKLGVEKLSDNTVFYKDLDRFKTEEQVRELDDVLWEYAYRCLEGQKYAIVDYDSTVETTEVTQGGVEVGYNPHKPGRGSYHPLLAFDGISRASLGGRLRSGNVHTAAGLEEFHNEIERRLPPGVTIKYVRGDQGFRGERSLSLFESKGVLYFLKMKVTPRLVRAAEKRRFRKLFETDDGLVIEATSFYYKATSWEKARRVVVIRKRLREDLRVKEGEQQFLWEELQYEYEAVVTNSDWEEGDAWHFYNHRANGENMIKEGKRGLGIDQISTDSFYANYVDFLIKLIAYNLFCAFKREAFPKRHRNLTIAVVRRMFFWITGILVHHGKRILRLDECHPWQKEWWEIRQKLALGGYG